LQAIEAAADLRHPSRAGILFRFVRPEVVVEVRCNDLLTTRAGGMPIRRPTLTWDPTGCRWRALPSQPLVSMINAVFVRERPDKGVDPVSLRVEQVASLVAVPQEVTPAHPDPEPRVIRREVYSRPSRKGTCIRKLVVVDTGSSDQTMRAPFAALFTDFSSNRATPMKTDLGAATTREGIEEQVETWIEENIKRGWSLASSTILTPVDAAHATAPEQPDAPMSVAGSRVAKAPLAIRIAVIRNHSPSFPIVVRRLRRLADHGTLDVDNDSRGRETYYELTLTRDLLAITRRLQALHPMIHRWKGTELSIDGEPSTPREVDALLDSLGDVARCHTRHRVRVAKGCSTCPTRSRFGCSHLRFLPSFNDDNASRFQGGSGDGQPWYAVGTFDGARLEIDKPELRRQLTQHGNEHLDLCPLFDRARPESAIDALPDTLDPTNCDDLVLLLHRSTGTPAWVIPREAEIPCGLVPTSGRDGAPLAGEAADGDDPLSVSPVSASNTGLGFCIEAKRPADSEPASPPAPRFHARLADVQGQDEAVEAVRDAILLPLRHSDLFEAVGIAPASGLLLHGPPGTGKTMLARAVATECGAHVEQVSGPELLSRWVGGSEQALRDVFDCARAHAPSVIVFDEIDAIAPARDDTGLQQHHRSVVAQLLVLLDGLEARGQLFVIATTNRPDAVDPALRRPGRFDHLIEVPLPTEQGRAAIFQHHLSRLRLCVPTTYLAPLCDELAAAASGFSGADIAHTCRQAALCAIKEALAADTPASEVAVQARHLQQAIQTPRAGPSRATGSCP
ncbi:MAG: ATP-binding protein, partial [Deltaproteobacteria bacterium]|nr:ATP-binding protein [Deltaproteobacteria bacterium]